MVQIKSEKEFIVHGCKAFRVHLADNNLPKTRDEIYKLLRRQKIVVDGKQYLVKGIEMYATPSEAEHKEIAIMVT